MAKAASLLKFLALVSALLLPQLALSNTTKKVPPLQHGKTYQGDIEIAQYWVSEKLDGVRAYWDGKHLISRRGNRFNAPIWFTQDFPKTPLDGELWIGRNQFERASGIVRTKRANNSDWRHLHYMIFDLPADSRSFDERVQAMANLVAATKSRYLKMVEQKKLVTEKQLEALLDKTVAQGGEGLMLHLGASHYQAKRTASLLKVKKYQDAEATVVAHLAGKGKFDGMLGAMLVKTPEGIEFKVGTGFSNNQRMNPPKIGSVITYKYFGKTLNGVPKFASFMRVRSDTEDLNVVK